MTRLGVLVVGCGNMGTSHARAYHRLADDFRIVGLVARGAASRERLAAEVGRPPTYADFETAYAATRPDVVSINTYPDTHAAIARAALKGGSHVFVEKPLAETVAEAEEHREGLVERDRHVQVAVAVEIGRGRAGRP